MMEKPRTLAEKKRLVEAFAEVFGPAGEPWTAEQIDRYLRRCGYDPEAGGWPRAAVAEKALASTRET